MEIWTSTICLVSLLYVLPVSNAWSTSEPTWIYLDITKNGVKPQVYDMEIDKYNPSRILFVTTKALYSTNGGDFMKLLAGSDEGYKEGLANEAKFRTIMSLVQKNERFVLLADRYNHCVREFDREKDIITTFAGICQRSGSTDGNLTGEAQFKEPQDLVLSGNRLYVVELNSTIRLINLKTKQVSTLYHEQTTLRLPLGLVEMDSNNLFITCNTGVVHYILASSQVSHLDDCEWDMPKKIIKLDKEVLAIVDGSGSVIVYNHTNNSVVLKICHGKSRHWENGTADECKLYGAYSILYHQKVLYIGGTGQIMAIKLARNHSEETFESLYAHLKSAVMDHKLVVICAVVGVVLIAGAIVIALLVKRRAREQNRNRCPTRETVPTSNSPEQQSRKPLLRPSGAAKSSASVSASMHAAGSSSPQVALKLKRR